MGLETSKHAAATYQPKGSYALQSELGNYQLTGDYLVSPSGDQYTLKSYTDATYQPKSGMSSYALQSELNNYQPKSGMTSYARQSELGNYQRKGEILAPLSTGDKYLLKGEIDKFYQPKDNYILQSEFNKFQRDISNDISILEKELRREINNVERSVGSIAPSNRSEGVVASPPPAVQPETERERLERLVNENNSKENRERIELLQKTGRLEAFLQSQKEAREREIAERNAKGGPSKYIRYNRNNNYLHY